MIRINSYKIFFVAFICSISFKGVSQTNSTATPKNHKFTFYLGAGPNYYFNNLVLAKDKVKELSYSFVGRIMWEPKHNLSLGIESGYNRLYSADGELSGGSAGHVHIVNAAIPIRIVISMKFFQNYYASFNMGQSILQNKVSTSNAGTFDASNVSLGDFGLDIGYRKLVSERFYLATEIKGTYSAKLEDKNIALVFLGGYRF